MVEPKLIRKHTKYYEILIKKGRKKPKEYSQYINNNLFQLNGHRLIIMSDMHTATGDVIDDLIKKKTINKNTIVITTGDMSGNGKMGGDSDPYDDYVKIQQSAGYFYFVQGNHDILNEKCKDIINDDGSFCMVDGRVVNSPLGTIGGINGIETDDSKVDHNIHKYSRKTYQKKLEFALNTRPDILLTHQPIQKSRIKILPKYHLCGHQPIEPYFVIDDDYTMINLDNKIMEFN
jgi:predicted MPP superfamily phosphohydrolase